MFLPISCTSPFTVAMTMRPCGFAPADFSASMNGSKYATAFFITRALFTTCGRNILPAPNRSPTTLIPAALSQVRLDFFVTGELSRIHDSHVQTGANSVKKKGRVHRFANSVVSPKGKQNFAYPATDTRAREILFDPASRFDEIHRVI